MQQQDSTQFSLAAQTDVGCYRESNEDNFAVCWDLPSAEWHMGSVEINEAKITGPGILMLVADGMGGVEGGEIASALAVEGVQAAFQDTDFELIRTPEEKIDFIEETLRTTHQAIIEHAEIHPEIGNMGTTAIIAWVQLPEVLLSWVGDSRAYTLQNGKIKRVSHDHTIVQALVDSGAISDWDAFLHPERHIITQALGLKGFELHPSHKIIELQAGDKLLLCSDGLNSMLRDEEIESILNHNYTSKQAVDALIDAANRAGGADNITVALIETPKDLFHQIKTIEIDGPALELGDDSIKNETILNEAVVKPKPRNWFWNILLIIIIIGLILLLVYQTQQ